MPGREKRQITRINEFGWQHRTPRTGNGKPGSFQKANYAGTIKKKKKGGTHNKKGRQSRRRVGKPGGKRHLQRGWKGLLYRMNSARRNRFNTRGRMAKKKNHSDPQRKEERRKLANSMQVAWKSKKGAARQ